jgi:4-amino-4-deoxy-L-arabinose transferase-like glycosyltransferase
LSTSLVARGRAEAARALGTSRTPSRPTRVAALAVIFLLALAVRSLYALDLAPVMYSRVQPGTRMAWRYNRAAASILRGEGVLWPRHPDPARTGLLARPPGYPLYLALVYGTLGRSFFTAQLVQNVLTSAGCVLLTLAAARLVGWRVGIGGGLISALSPHLAFSSNFVLPDALSALPLLAALTMLAGAHPGPRGRWWVSAMAGALVGAGVWLRPNVLLLAPFLAVIVVVVARERRRALGHAAALLVAAFAMIAPITLRNHAVFGEWVPVSINGGLTLWQGVADAGGEAEGAFRRDKLVMEEEAERYGNPRYREWWAEPDGIFRDRERYRRARAVIRAHPLLYARVVVGRAWEMLSYATAGPPTLAGDTAAAELLARTEDDDASDERRHDLGRQPADERWLAPGRAVRPLRPVLGAVQLVMLPALTPLALLGAAIILAARWRSGLLLLALPLYYLSTESFFLYEWRVAVPMHYALFACAAAPVVAAWSALRSAAGSALEPPDQNQAG